MPELERRAVNVQELRFVGDDSGPQKLVGYAALFNSSSEGLPFDEVFARGAFTETIKNDDVRSLMNHDPNFVLGRTTAGTLSLKQDKRGLLMETTPPDTQWARDLKVSVDRGDISQMSIGFIMVEQKLSFEKNQQKRTLTAVKLMDVSVVTFPVYDDTTVALRSIKAWQQEHPEFSVPSDWLEDAERRQRLMEAEVSLDSAQSVG